MSEDSRYRAAPMWLRLVRFYTFNFPVEKGKGRAFRFAKRFCRTFPENVLTATKDGRKLSVSFRDWVDDHIYFLGTYEPFCTQVVSRHILPGSVCFDVGANIGWYTTLFQSLCGSQGEVHSFEPVPSTFEELRCNVGLNPTRANVHLNQFGLGDEIRDIEIYLFPDDPSGHASLSAAGNINAKAIKTKISTLNTYLTERRISRVDFVKVDIEGAELMFLKGATRLFEQKTPPVILMEMSPETSDRFGYQPNDLIQFISGHATYDFFALDEKEKKLRPFDRFEVGSEGKNVLCVPRGLPELKTDHVNALSENAE
jgi:FkbM family methyltransferase